MKGNDFVTFFLNSPLHILMGNTMLITVTGRKTGRKYTTPVGYYQNGDELWVVTSRDRTWWRNLCAGAQVDLHLHGRNFTAFAEPILDEKAVASQIGNYLQHVPMAARPLGIRIGNDGPNAEDAARFARERLFVKVCLKPRGSNNP